MNKFFATTLSAVLLTTGGLGAANVLHPDKVEAAQAKYESSYSNYGSNYQLNIAAEALTQLPEYATVASKINMDGLTAKVTEDNTNKRIIVFSKANGQGQYKSIFVKATESLKIVDFRGGQIFYGTISTEDATPEKPAQPEEKPATDAISALPEYATLTSVVNVDNYKLQVVEDNTNKRVITLSDDFGRLQYKSIFVKNTNSLKVIDTRGGQIFYGVVSSETNTTAAPAPEKATAVKAEVEATAKTTATSSNSTFPEYATLASVVDVNSFNLQVVEDNYNKRIVLLKDANGRPHYKSIFVKRTNHLKVIDLKGGLLFNGTVR